MKITKNVSFDRKLQDFKTPPNWQFLAFFNELLSTQKVNVARFARNIEWDFFCDFQTLWGWKKKKIGNWILQKAKLADKWAQMKL